MTASSKFTSLQCALLAAAVALPLCAHSFSSVTKTLSSTSFQVAYFPSNRWSKLHYADHIQKSRRLSPHFAVSTEQETIDKEPEASGNSGTGFLRSIDSELGKYNKRRDQALQKLTQYDERLQLLQQKKNEYLAGAELGETPPGGSFTESTLRSAVKAMLWRVIAGSVTFVTSLQFSGSMSAALSIVGSDFLSKAVTMFIGERVMNKTQAGRKAGADNVQRSLAKALLWRLFAIVNTLTMALFIAKDLKVASKIAGSDAVFKTGLMFCYERVWAKVEWGKEYIIEFSI